MTLRCMFGLSSSAPAKTRLFRYTGSALILLMLGGQLLPTVALAASGQPSSPRDQAVEAGILTSPEARDISDELATEGYAIGTVVLRTERIKGHDVDLLPIERIGSEEISMPPGGTIDASVPVMLMVGRQGGSPDFLAEVRVEPRGSSYILDYRTPRLPDAKIRISIPLHDRTGEGVEAQIFGRLADGSFELMKEDAAGTLRFTSHPEVMPPESLQRISWSCIKNCIRDLIGSLSLWAMIKLITCIVSGLGGGLKWSELKDCMSDIDLGSAAATVLALLSCVGDC